MHHRFPRSPGRVLSQLELSAQQLVKHHGRSFTLGPLDFTVGPGVTCLVGANGAGKSTLFQLAAGVDRPNAGKLSITGSDSSPRLGYLPQDPQLPMGATCEQFLWYVAWLQRVPKRTRAAAVDQSLASVDLDRLRHERIKNLSGGQRRRLGIAHALVHGPELLLLDEPTVGLDPRQRAELRETIRLVGSECIALVSTHLVEDVRSLAHRVLVLNEGVLVFDGTVPELERLASADAPGDTDLERSLSTLMDGE